MRACVAASRLGAATAGAGGGEALGTAVGGAGATQAARTTSRLSAAAGSSRWTLVRARGGCVWLSGAEVMCGLSISPLGGARERGPSNPYGFLKNSRLVPGG